MKPLTAEPIYSLKRCPFCSGTDLRIWVDEVAVVANVSCKGCGCQGPPGAANLNNGETIADAKRKAQEQWQRGPKR